MSPPRARLTRWAWHLCEPVSLKGTLSVCAFTGPGPPGLFLFVARSCLPEKDRLFQLLEKDMALLVALNSQGPEGQTEDKGREA